MQHHLHNSQQIPAIGFGTYKATEDEGRKAIHYALESGYRLIDTAAFYFNEGTVGRAIRESGVPRDEILVTTKVWREELGYEGTKRAFQKSISKLGLDYIDIYLIHWPANARNYDHWQQVNQDTWRAMEELVDEGKIKTIGLSNFTLTYLRPLLDHARIKPAINQIEFHPGYWQPQLYDFCQNENILMEAWSPLARGRVFQNALLQQIAARHQKSVAQICLRWCVDKGVIPLPKSSTPDRIAANKDIFDFQLSTQEVRQIDALPQMGFSGELPDLWPDRAS